jgi:hypothetical protein
MIHKKEMGDNVGQMIMVIEKFVKGLLTKRRRKINM